MNKTQQLISDEFRTGGGGKYGYDRILWEKWETIAAHAPRSRWTRQDQMKTICPRRGETTSQNSVRDFCDFKITGFFL